MGLIRRSLRRPMRPKNRIQLFASKVSQFCTAHLSSSGLAASFNATLRTYFVDSNTMSNDFPIPRTSFLPFIFAYTAAIIFGLYRPPCASTPLSLSCNSLPALLHFRTSVCMGPYYRLGTVTRVLFLHRVRDVDRIAIKLVDSPGTEVTGLPLKHPCLNSARMVTDVAHFVGWCGSFII